jgi:hypothetical protein
VKFVELVADQPMTRSSQPSTVDAPRKRARAGKFLVEHQGAVMHLDDAGYGQAT